MAKLPSIHIYPGDWLRDQIAGCSVAAQGLWLRMMFLMHDSERYGYLVTNGVPTPSDVVARHCATTLDAYTLLLAELDAAGVPSRTKDGIIYSRRMVRDAQERESNTIRQRRLRAKPVAPLSRSCRADVAPMSRVYSSSSSSSSSISEEEESPLPPLPRERSAPTPGQTVADRDPDAGRAALAERFADTPHDATDDVPEAVLDAVRRFTGQRHVPKMVQFKLADCIALTSAEALLDCLKSAANEKPKPTLTAVMARAKTVEGGKGFAAGKSAKPGGNGDLW